MTGGAPGAAGSAGYGTVSFGADALGPDDTSTVALEPVAPAQAPAEPPNYEPPIYEPPIYEQPNYEQPNYEQPIPTVDDRAAPELVTCPECGAAARVTLNRRESGDFCPACDYPLFWTPSKVYRDRTDADESLRRLPGTVGRATLASLPCPHCAEPNGLTAQTCVRCGRSMHPVAAPPPPPPAPVLAPEPVYLPEPEPRVPWWVWLMLGMVVVAVVTLAMLYATDVIG